MSDVIVKKCDQEGCTNEEENHYDFQSEEHGRKIRCVVCKGVNSIMVTVKRSITAVWKNVLER